MKLPQISHTHKNCNFKSIIGKKIDQLLLSYKFYDRDMYRTFFIFGSCEPLKRSMIKRMEFQGPQIQ